MKKVLVLLVVMALATGSFAQEETKEKEKTKETTKKGFQKSNLFTGGSVSASFFTGGGAYGLSPHFGYSLTNWFDVAGVFNFNYQTQRDVMYAGDKIHQTVYGPAAFVRAFPIKFIFLQVQYEHNFIHEKYFYPTASGYPSQPFTSDANSLLIGGGYSQGREKGYNTYFYLAAMWDVLALPDSPYVDSYGRVSPVLKAGYNIALFQGKKERYVERRERRR
jgi:hypothetical protein